ncbi:hypothetical protein FOA52_014560 [Chlamydomonas sp. UWO 241]|nr:hypothetical protein FOA52_014560 [Chlamydomonas sp. UWO 241]
MAAAADKSKRYDRQIRIWGVHGQVRFETARVLLLNCSATGSETLKNLVLGGIASFTIVDGARVGAQDLGSNFMVDEASLGEPRAKMVTGLLQEMNDSVSGSFVEEAPETLLASNPSFFADFSLVIATQLRESDAIKLDEVCRSLKVPLLLARSYGLIGYIEPSLPEHLVVESKPDSAVEDLRLAHPFPQLRDWALSFDLASLDDHMYLHVPYVVLLLHAAEQWKAQQATAGAAAGGPSTSKERAAFKELINGMRRQHDGVPLDQINFDEALKAAFHVWTQPAIPPEVRALLADPAAANLTNDSDDFWFIIAGLAAFVAAENEGGGLLLPLEGSIPDMHAITDLYLQIQRVYRDKADADTNAVQAHVGAALQRMGRPADSIGRDAVRLACKNARNLRVVRYRPMSTELSGDGGRRGAALQRMLSGEGTGLADAAFYVLLRAADRFHGAHGRLPGTYDSQVEEDVPLLKSMANQILAEVGACGVAVPDDCVVEMCRFGAGELHVVASVVGGMAAQEAIKLITKQFMPVPGVLLYNAIASTTTVL